MAQKLYTLTVKKKKLECEDTCTLTLSPNEEDQAIFQHKPAQFLNFHLNLKGKDVIRSYSLSSSPLLSEPLITTIKKVSNGLVSHFLVNELKENDTIKSTKPLGKFFKIPKNLKPIHYFIIGAGSGITPLFSIIKTALASDEKNVVTLVYCNRNESSIIYKEELKKYHIQYKNRFKIIHILSQPYTFHHDYTGRLNKEILTKIFEQYISNSQWNKILPIEYYLCGPLDLMKMVENVFIEANVDKKHIHKESFGAITPRKEESLSKKTQSSSLSLPSSAVIITADIENEIAPSKKIKALLEGEHIEVSTQENLTILENLIESGHSPPFSCMAGNCMTCIATLKKGRVYQDEAGILDDENINNKEILTCQAKPLSSIVEVDYDS